MTESKHFHFGCRRIAITQQTQNKYFEKNNKSIGQKILRRNKNTVKMLSKRY